MSAAHVGPAAAARKLGVHPGTLANWRQWGFGPKFIKRGHRVWYAEKDLERFSKERQP
jgi:transposase-like protein